MSPATVSQKDSPCAKGTKKAIAQRIKELVQKAGEPAFNIFKSTWNALMEQVKAILQPFLTLLETVLTIDKFVYDTFVKPPLMAVIDELAAVQDKIKKPLSMLQMDASCKDMQKFREGVNKTVGFLTKDVNGLRNWVERLDYNFRWQEDLISALEQGVAMLVNLTIKAGYNDWVQSDYDFEYLFVGPE